MKPQHTPVLLEEVLQYFRGSEIEVFVDGTLGLGGHASALLKEHPEIKIYIGFDQDKNAINVARERLQNDSHRTEFIQLNFSEIPEVFREKRIESVDGFLFDLGVSSMQLSAKERGFSFQQDGPLDMRMNDLEDMTAERVVNEYPEKKLGEIFRDLGEEPMWRRIAKEITVQRKKRRIKTTKELSDIIQSVKRRRGKLHPATLVFQALRIFVNRELEVLEKTLEFVCEHLCVQGKVGVISFHSLEDRIVKHTFRNKAKEGWVEILTKKPITATRQESRENPRARSAKLRFCERSAS